MMDKFKIIQEQDDINEELNALGDIIRDAVDSQKRIFLELSDKCAYRKEIESGSEGSACLKRYPDFIGTALNFKECCNLRTCPFVKWNTM